MAPPQRPASLSLHRRAWRDAKDFYRTFWFKVPTALLTTGAIVTGALLPQDASAEVVTALAVSSGVGVAFALGLVVVFVMLALAPSRRRYDGLRERLDKLETRQKAVPATAGTQVIAQAGSNVDARTIQGGSIGGTITSPGTSPGGSGLWLPGQDD